MQIQFDSNHNPIMPTYVLCNRDGDKIGILKANHVKTADKFNSFDEISFSVDKDDCPFWDEIKSFKLIWDKDNDLWYEAYVSLSDNDSITKQITTKSLAIAELSQTNIYSVQVSADDNIVFYDAINTDTSLLNILLSQAPHYAIQSVSASLMSEKRTMTFDGINIYDALQSLSEEYNCYIEYAVHSDENGYPSRKISVYDIDTYGADSGIFVSSENLTDEINFTTNVDSVKNCFKLEAGDDKMNRAIWNCNPNGSAYIWYLTPAMIADMPSSLVSRLQAYTALQEQYNADYTYTPNANNRAAYNLLADEYNTDSINTPVIGFPAILTEINKANALYAIIRDTYAPSSEQITTSASAEAAKITSLVMPIIGMSGTNYASNIDSAITGYADAIINPRYHTTVKNKTFNNNIWTGILTVIDNNSNDTADTAQLAVTATDNALTYCRQSAHKALASANNYDIDIISLFELTDVTFAERLHQYCLIRLQSLMDCCNAALNFLIEQGAGNPDTWTDTADADNQYLQLYQPYYNKMNIIQSEIATRKNEISVVSATIDEFDSAIADIHSALDFKNYLGDALWLQFIAYRREDIYSNTNYTSDGLSDVEIQTNALQFIADANDAIYQSANLQHSITTDLKNLLVIHDFDGLTDDFKVGNYIHIKCDDSVYKLRLLSFSVDFDNLENITVEFSDVIKSREKTADIASILNQAQSMASSFDAVTRQAKQGKTSREQLDGWTSNGLDLTALKIINNADNQDYIFDSHGMLFRKYQPITDTYSNEQLKIINSTIAMTNNGWQSVKTAVGSLYFINPLNNQLTYGYGINGEMIIGKILLGENLGIYNSGATLKFNKDGLYVSNDDYTFTVNPNDTNKLLSISDGTNDVFKVTSSGLYISGEVNATSGNIGGCSIVDGVLKVPSANITGTLTAAQIDVSGLITSGGLVVSSDLPTKTSDLQNDSGFENETGVVSIIDGRITADYINALGITVGAANITGQLTIGQLPSSVAQTDDIPTKTSDLTNDNGFTTETGVTTIIDGRITTDYINALGISVAAANISGQLTIGQLPSNIATTDDIPSVPSKISELLNDSGYKTYSDVTSIIDGRITTNYVNALGITAGAMYIRNASNYTLFSAGGNSVSIAGWNVDNNSFYSGSTFNGSDAFLCTGTNSTMTIAGHTGNGWVLKAGDNFGVNRDGQMYCTSGDFSGKITTNSGSIGGFNISPYGITRINTDVISEEYQLYDRDTIMITSAGTIMVKNETLDGTMPILTRSTTITPSGIAIALSGAELPSAAASRAFMYVTVQGTTHGLYIDDATQTVKVT